MFVREDMYDGGLCRGISFGKGEQRALFPLTMVGSGGHTDIGIE